MTKSEVLRVRMTAEDLQMLLCLAERIGWSRSSVVRALIRSATLGPQPVPMAGPLHPEDRDKPPAEKASDEAEREVQYDV